MTWIADGGTILLPRTFGAELALVGKGKFMAYYPKSIFYPVICNAHNSILRFAAEAVRQPVFMLNGAVGELPSGELPEGVDIALLDDREHVLTVNTTSSTAQFSQKQVDQLCAPRLA